MICQIYPQIEGIALERFRRLSKDVMHLQRTGQLDRLDGLRDGELQRCQAEPGLNGCPEKYEACVRVLIDLAKLRWRIEEDRFGIELVAPRSNVVDPAQIAEYKETVRNELAPQLARQFAAKPVRTFIRQMEARSASSKRKPIQLLIADGRELRSRLLDASEARGAERVERLARAVQPYLQLVESGAVDEFTNIPLGDIWRYCRYTWTLPQTNIPGRQLWYLVRDRAHPHHAIIGIAALSNAPLQMAERDDALGWSVNGFTNEVAAALAGPPATALPRLLDNLESNLARALNGIDATNLARPHEIADPTPELIARLRRRGDEFASVRAEILENFTVETPLIIQETEDLEYAMPPVSDDVLRLDQKISSDPKIDSVRRAMVAKKRATELARLLQARIVFRKWRALFCDPATARATLEREEFSSAVNSALEAAKSARAGTNMLEITTCGAVKPYNAILGGKLVSLLMLSPEVASDYRRRYGAEPSIISSLIKNAPVCKDSRLVFLGTTSLYAHGPSQYNRLRLPCGVIASEQDEIRFEMLGHTGGFGTVHFPDETTRAIERVLEQEQGFRDVNSIFGEGRSPKLRKLRAGLKLLGFDPTAVLQHHQPRCIYGIRLCAGAGDFLLGKTDELPRYIEHPEEYREATARIASFWRERWLASRLDHAPALETLQQTPAWRLSETIPVLDAPKAEIIAHARAEAPSVTAAPLASAAEDLEFWRTLARAGKTVCSDELSVANLARLHVQTPFEDFLISKVREGFSLVLTGNAGDGKTHLMRRLAAELERAGADVEPDATAAMRHGSVAPILDRWRAALAANKPYCLAANEYPLYLLRRDGRPHLPLLEEVERQCRHRLAYGPPANIEDARDRVLVVDLSLRNPLEHTFAAAALEKILAEPAVQQHAASNTDATFSWNYLHLANATVRARIISMFQRLVSRGHRCSIRELWIVLTRLLFGAAHNGIEPTLAPRTWYSERLFEADDRFQLNALLRRLADPAASSHPQWDMRLEDADGTVPADWLVDTHVPPLDRRALTRPQFQALKRRFYFEHRLGDEAFALQASDAREFLDLLREAATPDDIFKARLIRAINQCYCPKPFPGSDSALHLWIGHRFHEQPSRCFLANQSIPASAFEVFVPRLPRRLSGALDYHPDHLVLEYRDANEICRLKIDYALFSTLAKIAAGFPRHLAAERDLNRLDAFLDEIKGREPERKRQFILFSSESRLVTRVTLAPDFKQYTEVEPL